MQLRQSTAVSIHGALTEHCVGSVVYRLCICSIHVGYSQLLHSSLTVRSPFVMLEKFLLSNSLTADS